jgi:hypothetical protein
MQFLTPPLVKHFREGIENFSFIAKYMQSRVSVILGVPGDVRFCLEGPESGMVADLVV